MILLSLWVSKESYQLGWNDHAEGKWIGDKEDTMGCHIQA